MRPVVLASCVIALAGVSSASQGAASSQHSAASATCDESAIDPESYRLTTEAQALNVLRPREPWWEPYGIWSRPGEIGTVNAGALRLAERAKELDDHNLLAHGHLARQMVVAAVDARQAEEAWRRVLDNGGALVWTATLPEIDPRSFFVLAFDRRGIHVYPFTQLAGDVPTHFGFQEFPDVDRQVFWRALGGCLPDGVTPEVLIPWGEVREMRASDRTLRVELQAPVEIRSDRGSRRDDDTLKINLHGQTGVIDSRFAMRPFARPPFYGRPFHGPPSGADPGAYQLRVLQMLVTLFDPERRIRTPDLTIATLPPPAPAGKQPLLSAR